MSANNKEQTKVDNNIVEVLKELQVSFAGLDYKKELFENARKLSQAETILRMSTPDKLKTYLRMKLNQRFITLFHVKYSDNAQILLEDFGFNGEDEILQTFLKKLTSTELESLLKIEQFKPPYSSAFKEFLLSTKYRHMSPSSCANELVKCVRNPSLLLHIKSLVSNKELSHTTIEPGQDKLSKEMINEITQAFKTIDENDQMEINHVRSTQKFDDNAPKKQEFSGKNEATREARGFNVTKLSIEELQSRLNGHCNYCKGDKHTKSTCFFFKMNEIIKSSSKYYVSANVTHHISNNYPPSLFL